MRARGDRRALAYSGKAGMYVTNKPETALVLSWNGSLLLFLSFVSLLSLCNNIMYSLCMLHERILLSILLLLVYSRHPANHFRLHGDEKSTKKIPGECLF